MKRTQSFLLIPFLVLCALNAFPQALFNNYAKVYIKQGAQVVVKTNSVRNDNLIDNAGDFTIEQDFINNDSATGGNASGIYNVQRDWINNGDFSADQSTVNLYGDNQLITGTSVTQFYDLELTGSGIKRQTINSETMNLLALNDRELATDDFEMLVSNTSTNAITRATGFVSSTGSGRLSRNTAESNDYLFPTGSSLGVPRYRPVVITPSTVAPHTFGARLANTDATSEGFDRAAKHAEICLVNPDYYHRLYRTAGNDAANIALHYDPAADGDWQDAAHWQNQPRWETLSATASINPPFSTYILNAWDDFTFPAFAFVNFGPIASLTPVDATCFGADDGAISSNVSGGNPPYNYSWSNGATTSSLSDLPGGIYTLTVTDNGNCSIILSDSITEPISIYTINQTIPAFCEDGSNGGIKLIIFGGTEPYQTSWSNGGTGTELTGLQPGVYIATIVDAKNCLYETTISLDSESEFSVEIENENVACDNATASLSADIILNTMPPYTYQWNTGATSPTVTGLSPGVYSVTVVDSLNCIKTASGIIAVTGFIIEAEVSDASCPGVRDGAALASITGGNAPYSYLWSNGTLSAENSNIVSGLYFVTVTDRDNCAGISDSIKILTVGTECEPLVIYDVFSPNGDGVNDLWIIDGLEVFPQNEIQIFNRWGNVVFEAKPFNNYWNGVSKKGEHLPIGSYYYILKLNNPEDSVFSGNITIVR